MVDTVEDEEHRDELSATAASNDISVDEADDKAPSRMRLVLLAVFFVGSFIYAKQSGLLDNVTQESVREQIDSLGPFGFFLFVVMFSVGELVHIPGVVFVGAAVLVWGKLIGGLAAFVGAVAAVSVSFAVVRAVGGKQLTSMKWERAQRMIDRVEHSPVTSVIILRLILWFLPALTYALAMSPIKFRDHLVGSAIGLLLPVVLVAFFLEQILAFIATL